MLGRFISADTIVPQANDPQSWNRFSYVRNNPLNRIDPTGHRDCIDNDNCAGAGPYIVGPGTKGDTGGPGGSGKQSIEPAKQVGEPGPYREFYIDTSGNYVRIGFNGEVNIDVAERLFTPQTAEFYIQSLENGVKGAHGLSKHGWSLDADLKLQAAARKSSLPQTRVATSIEAAAAIQDTIVSNIQWINDLAEKQSKGTIWLQGPEVNYTGYEPGGKPIKPGTAPLSVGIKLDGKGNWGLFDFYPKVK